jgi:hypothetical protein
MAVSRELRTKAGVLFKEQVNHAERMFSLLPCAQLKRPKLHSVKISVQKAGF